jgi:DNA-binding LacI/PurR family transcriptional regulator
VAVVARVTLQQLATDLGVSRATVSNAYNRPDQLSSALRERVLARAAELGFAGPDPVARGLRRGRVGAVGVLVDRSVSHAFSDPVAVLVLDGLAHELQTDGYGLLLHAADRRPASTQVVRSAAVDGWVVLSVPTGHPTVAAARAHGRPMVVLDQPRLPGVPLVTIDDVGGARAATTHLLELGHRSIGVLTPPLDVDDAGGQVGVDRAADAADEVMSRRLSGVFAALGQAGVAEDEVPVVECSANDEQAGAVGAALLLDDPARPTAVLALSDQLALGVLRCAGERGAGVPSGLSVVGFDDAPPGRTASPPLTTVAQPLRERGIAAGALLRQLLQGEHPSSPQPYATRLVVRGSTARPAR